jgi:hypothetical protein
MPLTDVRFKKYSAQKPKKPKKPPQVGLHLPRREHLTAQKLRKNCAKTPLFSR